MHDQDHAYDSTTPLEELTETELAHLSERLDVNHSCKIGRFEYDEILITIDCPFGGRMRVDVHQRRTVGQVYAAVEALRSLATAPQAPVVPTTPAPAAPVPLNEEEWSMLEHWIQAAHALEWVRFKCARRVHQVAAPGTMHPANLSQAEEAYQSTLRRLAPLYHRMMPVA